MMISSLYRFTDARLWYECGRRRWWWNATAITNPSTANAANGVGWTSPPSGQHGFICYLFGGEWRQHARQSMIQIHWRCWEEQEQLAVDQIIKGAAIKCKFDDQSEGYLNWLWAQGEGRGGDGVIKIRCASVWMSLKLIGKVEDANKNQDEGWN